MTAQPPVLRGGGSPNFGPRRCGPVDMLVLHYTGMARQGEALQRLCDPASGVSAHYLIEENGCIHPLVAEDQRAWHAGVACWRGVADVNSRSIGLELENPGHEHGLRPFPPAQMRALITLCKGILARHPIPPRNVVGHSDIAPCRKQDPGELFDWRTLAREGVGLWPQPQPAAVGELVGMLAEIGYPVTDPAAAIAAFQRRFRPRAITGQADAETAALAAGMLQAIGE